MERIQSFSVNHLNLLSGLYVSRKDSFNGVVVTSFDLRITAPNREPVIDIPALHTIEHLGATFLRNSAEKEKVVYFGPMGCQTGFYLLTRDCDDITVYNVVISVLEKIISYDGEMFGASRKECGNYKNLDLSCAKAECKKYLEALRERGADFKYPEE